ncbi:hypothetical protein ACFWIA_30455 [Streptomyces sp. NPDC127068]
MPRPPVATPVPETAGDDQELVLKDLTRNLAVSSHAATVDQVAHDHIAW